VDEQAFRQARGAVNPQPCAFEKAVLAGCCACALGQRRFLAEREAVACLDPAVRTHCLQLRVLLHRNAAFALKHPHAEEPLPHAQEMRVQCGGLQGLQAAIAPADGVRDVAGLVRGALARYESLENLPWLPIIQAITAFRLRRRRS
jgi:hypothetical protein